MVHVLLECVIARRMPSVLSDCNKTVQSLRNGSLGELKRVEDISGRTFAKFKAFAALLHMIL